MGNPNVGWSGNVRKVRDKKLSFVELKKKFYESEIEEEQIAFIRAVRPVYDSSMALDLHVVIQFFVDIWDERSKESLAVQKVAWQQFLRYFIRKSYISNHIDEKSMKLIVDILANKDSCGEKLGYWDSPETKTLRKYLEDLYKYLNFISDQLGVFEREKFYSALVNSGNTNILLTDQSRYSEHILAIPILYNEAYKAIKDLCIDFGSRGIVDCNLGHLEGDYKALAVKKVKGNGFVCGNPQVWGELQKDIAKIWIVCGSYRASCFAKRDDIQPWVDQFGLQLVKTLTVLFADCLKIEAPSYYSPGA